MKHFDYQLIIAMASKSPFYKTVDYQQLTHIQQIKKLETIDYQRVSQCSTVFRVKKWNALAVWSLGHLVIESLAPSQGVRSSEPALQHPGEDAGSSARDPAETGKIKPSGFDLVIGHQYSADLNQ